MAELVEHLGGIPIERIRLRPTLRDSDTLAGGEVLPGFRLAVTARFDRAGQRE